MREFLNENLKPYKALTREEKHILLDNNIDGVVEVWLGNVDGWYQIGSCQAFCHSTVYRTKPKEYKKLNVPWELIDNYWNYAVMEGDGSLLLYATKPEWLAEHCMWSCNHSYHSLSILKLDTTGIVAEHSLTMRPEGV